MTSAEVLVLYRRILDRIHQAGNIYYNRAQFDAYALVARVASDYRTAYLGS